MEAGLRAKSEVTRRKQATVNDASTVGTLSALRLVLVPIDTGTVGRVGRVLNVHVDTACRNLPSYDLSAPLPVRDVPSSAADNATTPVACLETNHAEEPIPKDRTHRSTVGHTVTMWNETVLLGRKPLAVLVLVVPRSDISSLVYISQQLVVAVQKVVLEEVCAGQLRPAVVGHTVPIMGVIRRTVVTFTTRNKQVLS